MKVVYLNYLYDIKELSVGANVHVKELVQALNRQGHNVKDYNLNPFQSAESSTDTKARNVLKSRLKLYRYLNQLNAIKANVKYFIQAMRIIKKERPDVILMRYNRMNVAMALIRAIKKIPLVLEMNAPLSYEYRKFCNDIVHLPVLPEFTERLSLKAADRIYVVSKALKNYFVKWNIPSNKIFVIPNGADCKKFSEKKDGKDIILKYGLTGKIVIGFISSFHYWHGIENLYEFIDLTLKNYNNVSFMLIGSGPKKEQFEQTIKKKKMDDRVIITGYVSHQTIPQYLAAMDIVLAIYPPMKFFYFSPLKLFEYMAAGKPVIASDIGQISDIIEDSKNGILFDPKNLNELKKKAFKLIEDKQLRIEISKHARQTIVEQYTWNHTINLLENILLDACRKRQNINNNIRSRQKQLDGKGKD